MSEFKAAKEHFEQALRDLEQYGNQLQLLSEVHYWLGEIASKNGQLQERIDEIDTARKLTSQYLQGVLPGLSPEEQQDYLLNHFSENLAASLAFGLNNKNNAQASFASAEWLINGKGLGEELAAETALLAAPETAPFVQELRGVRDEIARLWIQDPEMEVVENRRQIAELEAKENSLRQEIAKRNPNRETGESWVTVGELMSRLPSDGALVNVARIPLFEFELRKRRDSDSDSFDEVDESEFHYVAWIIPHIAKGKIQIVDLGKAQTIDGLIAEFKASIETEGAARSLTVPDGKELNQEKTKAVTKELSELLVAPLEAHLESVEKLFLSPDAALWQIPWDSLVTSDGKFVIETFETAYVISGRELASGNSPSANLGKPVIFANPSFDLDVKKMGERVSDDSKRARVGGYFAELPGTAKEAKSILPSIENFTKQPCDLFTQGDALESKFKQLHRPEVLVLSTHGFYVEDKLVDQMSAHNPLIRCGLALAGCNQREEALRQNKEDGILTGLEIIGTDLRGTQLVVLSACETAVGQSQSGEGVVGLRQAFQLAGAESVVASLWSVSDNETAELMTEFFDQLSQGQKVSSAFREAQLLRIEVLA